MAHETIYDLAFNTDSTSLIKAQIHEALTVIDSALDSFKCDDLVISFNGGKDCTVLLHLYAAVLSKREVKTRIRAVYIPLPSPYEELESFIQESVVRYNLDLFHCLPTMSTSGDQLPVESVKGGGQRYRGGEGMRKALEVYKEKFPQVEGILMGTRRTDPDGKSLSFRSPTDAGWPSFMRVNPIINWSYTDVWEFLREFDVPYCKLYDLGYTSIGSTYNTFPNPALLKGTEYLPAYQLLDGSLERAGRGAAPPKN